MAEARELAGWADPRATAFFFGAGPAAAWLKALQEHTPHLLLDDETAGVWPSAPFLRYLDAVAPEAGDEETERLRSHPAIAYLRGSARPGRLLLAPTAPRTPRGRRPRPGRPPGRRSAHHG
ncbi:hypothetical protein [Streptomyces sp. WELS2]|uniref:hypothetical protein n=1 Tax=Streptomyces sp. WELS2 TaxID=2749435 RepID=UPI0015F018FC|nr:hypothetical protein [Streptomyces sp. WELS2]